MICADSQRQKRLLLQRITHILLSISLSSSPRHLSSRESEGNVATAAIHKQNRYCSKCKEHVQAFKKLDLWKLPEILVVHLKRFHYSQGRYVKTFVTRDKINTVVDFPVTEVLDMGDLSIGTSPPPPAATGAATVVAGTACVEAKNNVYYAWLQIFEVYVKQKFNVDPEEVVVQLLPYQAPQLGDTTTAGTA